MTCSPGTSSSARRGYASEGVPTTSAPPGIHTMPWRGAGSGTGGAIVLFLAEALGASTELGFDSGFEQAMVETRIRARARAFTAPCARHVRAGQAPSS